MLFVSGHAPQKYSECRQTFWINQLNKPNLRVLNLLSMTLNTQGEICPLRFELENKNYQLYSKLYFVLLIKIKGLLPEQLSWHWKELCKLPMEKINQ